MTQEISSKDFYRNLPTESNFMMATDLTRYHQLPDDWFIVVADVVNSTQAIRKGRYKDVNILGASVIVGLLNLDKSLSIPFVFGGDGATLAIPSMIENKARGVLEEIKILARQKFQLELRTGIMAVKDLTSSGYQTCVAKVFQSPQVSQTMFFGSGWGVAEQSVKSAALNLVKSVNAKGQILSDYKVDLSGLVCRWDELESRNDHKICIIIKAKSETQSEQIKVYQNALKEIYKVYGTSDDHHPIFSDSMKKSLNPYIIFTEAKLNEKRGWPFQLIYSLKYFAMNLLARTVLKKHPGMVNFKRDMVHHTDYQKFDGMIKMILDGTKEQKNKITQYLKEKYHSGELVYGTHSSKSALMTCLIFSPETHAHFIDGADGGYALASLDLKEKEKSFENSRRKSVA